jgi:hypothetical protein
VTGMKFDPSWVSGYGALAADSAGALAEGVETMAVAPLDDESFGELGRTIHTAEAYGTAANMLRDQLSRAVETLTSAAAGLEKLTAAYRDVDEQTIQAIRREMPS